MAPAFTAPTTEESSRTLVRAMTSVSGSSPRIASVAATPSITGISRSIRITSGRSSLALLSACAPSSASPTTSSSESSARNIRKPWRTTLWSSAIRTRIVTERPRSHYSDSLVDDKRPHRAGSGMPLRLLTEAAGRTEVAVRTRRRHDSGRIARRDTGCVMEPIQVLLVDDEPQVLRGLRMRLGLEADISVVGEAADGATAVDFAILFSPDVVLMDINLPVVDGITATRELAARRPPAAVVILSLHDDQGTIDRALAAGAAAFVAKHQRDGDVLGAIRMAAERTKGGALGNTTDQTERIKRIEQG